jgi:hypothetical protein
MFIAITFIVIAYFFFRSPLADSLSEALRRGGGVENPRLEQALARITEELAELREHVTELAERVDFTERALADVRRRDALPNPRS